MFSVKRMFGVLSVAVLLAGCADEGMVNPPLGGKSGKTLINQGEKDIMFKYDKTGRLTTKIYYETGDREFIKKIQTFYPEGAMKEEMHYTKGYLHGTSRVWYPDGQLKMVVLFRNDKPDGVEKWFYKDGKLKSEVSYKMGVLHGKVKMYYETGELKAEVLFQNNQPVENEKIYYKTGELKYVTDFDNGVIKDSF